MARRKILALVSEPVSGDARRRALGGAPPPDTPGLVVAPALNSSTRWFVDDPDPAIERAEGVQEETVERMDDEDVDAAGDTGESDPLLAIQDALATFEAEEIVLFTHPNSDRNWLEEGLVDAAKERFGGQRVSHFVVE